MLTSDTTATDPLVTAITTADGVEQYVLQDIELESRRWSMDLIPTRYRDATVTVPAIRDWVSELVKGALRDMRAGHPVVRTGPSLVLAGPAGRGKSWQAWGAMRALSVCGAHCRWKFLTASDMFAQLRPRHGVDSEDEFDNISRAEVLVIDDLGAAKDSAWTEETLARVIDHRSKWVRPTLVTTNIPPPAFVDRFGDRVASRLAEMAVVVPFLGADLRRAAQ